MAYSALHEQQGHKQLASPWEVISPLPRIPQQSSVVLTHIRCSLQLSQLCPYCTLAACTERGPKVTCRAANQFPSAAMTTNSELS